MTERKARISYVPRKVRDLKADLRKAGFAEQRGRGHGSHKVWAHPLVPDADVIISGHDSDDAHHYQEKEVRDALRKVREATT
jgi:predicted RNA binding protein YcfA (HicA-like mRNA interferase family)